MDILATFCKSYYVTSSNPNGYTLSITEVSIQFILGLEIILSVITAVQKSINTLCTAIFAPVA